MGKTIQLHIEGMTCTSCAQAVEKALASVPQVKVANVNFAGKKALLDVDGDGPAARAGDGDLGARLRKAISDAGYEVVDPAEKRAKAEAVVRREGRRLLWSWVITAPLMVQMLLHMVWGIHVLPMAIRPWVTLALAAVVVFGIGWPVIRSTIHSFRTFAFTMDSLIGIGSVAALSTGVLRLAGVSIGDFTAVGAMIVAINYVGSYIKVRATGRASSAIRQLLELGAREATRIEPDGSESTVEVTALEPGDIVRVRPGGKIPLDGTIVRGTTSIDESIVTGESVPADKQPGDTVVGATINQMGSIDVRVEKTGEATFLAQIIALVEEAQASRVPVQELADRVTAIFVPAILALALVTFGGWVGLSSLGVLDADVSAALSAAIATLVIACPCALGLATPTALMVGMGWGAERGILIRNGEAIQTARSLDTILFDKTGTLTIGRPEVQAAETDSEATLLTLAVESASEHPLARALTTWLREQSTAGAAPPLESSEAVPGHGIRARVAGGEVLVGSIRWLREQGCTLDERLTARIEQWRDAGMTVVGTGRGGVVIAAFALADTVRPDTRAAIAALHEAGLTVGMLTGDAEAAARSIAREAGIDEVYAELLPQDKIDVVRRLQSEGRTVAMVGDGINDAPALKQAQVGIAVGTGTDTAIESADITLMSSNLAGIARAVRLSQRTFATIRGNLFWAFGYNVVAIPLAVAGLLHPVVAEIAMAFSSITVVSNSLRLRRTLRRQEA